MIGGTASLLEPSSAHLQQIMRIACLVCEYHSPLYIVFVKENKYIWRRFNSVDSHAVEEKARTPNTQPFFYKNSTTSTCKKVELRYRYCNGYISVSLYLSSLPLWSCSFLRKEAILLSLQFSQFSWVVSPGFFFERVIGHPNFMREARLPRCLL